MYTKHNNHIHNDKKKEPKEPTPFIKVKVFLLKLIMKGDEPENLIIETRRRKHRQ
jgi:hypothetical protein